jgi:hypothetical protein
LSCLWEGEDDTERNPASLFHLDSRRFTCGYVAGMQQILPMMKRNHLRMYLCKSENGSEKERENLVLFCKRRTIFLLRPLRYQVPIKKSYDIIARIPFNFRGVITYRGLKRFVRTKSLD